MAGTMTRTEPRAKSSWLRPRNLFQEMEEMLSDVMGSEPEGWFTRRMTPALDVVECENEVKVKMDLPGMKPKEIDIQVHNNLLTISGERKEEKEEHEGAYLRLERRSGSFSRSFTLPCPINEKEVVAKYENGLLSITLPKTEESKAHKVEVKS